MSDLTADLIRSRLLYDQETGVFRWVDGEPAGRGGVVAGYIDKHGYRQIGVNGKNRPAHHLVWLHVFGRLPNGVIDHINGDGSDNRLSNLRECTRQQNQFNRKMNKNNKTGHKCINKCQTSNEWQVRVKMGNKIERYLCDHLDDAIRARDDAFARLHGEFSSIFSRKD